MFLITLDPESWIVSWAAKCNGSVSFWSEFSDFHNSLSKTALKKHKNHRKISAKKNCAHHYSAIFITWRSWSISVLIRIIMTCCISRRTIYCNSIGSLMIHSKRVSSLNLFSGWESQLCLSFRLNHRLTWNF